MPTYTGDNSDNTINGSNGSDTISGQGGDDTLSGGNGGDTISGGSGDDEIDGGNGDDGIDGGTGDDTLDGGNGDDAINGGDDNDIIYGGNGGDTLNGGAGNDQLYGQNGDDKLTGGAGDDLLDGNNGFDIAYYSGPIGEYSFYSAAGYLHVVHLGGAGADGHDQLIRVERLVFADRVINIGSGSNKPVAGDDHVFITEDTGTYSSGAASVKDNDFDFDGDTLTVTGGTFVGTYGTLTLNANGTYSYTLNASAQGLDDSETVTDSFNYTVTDNDGSDTGTLVFHIAGVNDAPVANDDTAATSEDAAVSGNVLANDTDVDVEPLTVANPGTYVGAYGTLVLAADGSYTYTPNAAAQALDDGEVVSDSFSYTASDGTASDAATLTLTVTGLNDAPVANDDTASTTEETAVSGNVLANDTDVDVEPLTVTNPGTYVGTYGTLTLAVDGSYTFTPNATAQGLDDGEVVSDAFGYTVSDGTASDGATLTVDVAGLNDAPVANDDTASTNEDTAVSGNVLANDTDADVEPLAVANPGTYAGAYGTLVLAADGSYTYTPNAAAQALDDGEVVNDTFGYVATDGTASDTATLAVAVIGLNDAPVANDDSAATTEEAAVSGNVLANDIDVDVEPLTVTNPGTYVGTYGTLVLAADGSYTYTPNAVAQALDDGEVVGDVFGYTASDGTSSDTATLTVDVSGLNDAPVANDDAASTTEDAAVSGNVLANDTDVDVEPLTVANPGTYTGAYGTLVLAADGSYTYTPNAVAQALDDGEVVSDTFGYTASDGTASDTAILAIDVSGLNDAPVANDDTASTAEDAAVSGNVLANDTDVDIEPLTATNPGTYAGTYGSLTLAADGSYTYTPNAAANGLAAGEVAQDVFGYTASDGTASDTGTLTVTVNGTNDAPTINAGGTDAAGSVTELPNNDPNENAFTHTDSGTIAFADVDVSDTHTASFTPQGGGYLGIFTLDPVNQAGDTVGWDFSVADSDLDFLADGETLTQTYTVEIDDGNGGTTTQDVTITLTGAADGPQTVWYIDNSAVGSANLGTQADPFTSIAAFNAAQGTVGGPQVGATVYLLAGTGTYTEADGLNLFDDQVVVGVADGVVRPTIVVTGAGNDGIELAQNNTISGLDIGNTADAGIVDGNGSVGTLTISDVGKSGTGQIIDIDQGGTLNVTLNSAESLASNDGAIDLAGVGGSFTVTGATTITGIHSDGGIDITGSSVAASFAGGGTISTNNAVAINFVGNSGSLALGGGLAIVTTTGTGLNASGGGTVTATGAGNSISTVFGTALNIVGTAIGANDLTFESISAGSGAGSAGVGINLSGTGAAGGLHVTGTGTAGSGGTIQNKTGADGSTTSGIGIVLNDTAEVQLNNVQLNGFDNFAIHASDVNGLTLSNSVISGDSGNSAAADEGAILMLNSSGAIAITGSQISGGYEDNLRVLYDSANADIATYTIQGNAFTDLGAGNNAMINLRSMSTASAASNVTFNIGDPTNAALGNTFDNSLNQNPLPPPASPQWFGDGVLATFDGGFQHTVTVDNNTFNELAQAVDLVTNLGADLDARVYGNDISFIENAAIVVGTGSASTAASLVQVLIEDNAIGTGAVDSGSRQGEGILGDFRGNEIARVTIHQNVIQHTEIAGIRTIGQTAADGDLHLRVTDNVISSIDDDTGGGTSLIYGIEVTTSGGSHDVFLTMTGNDSVGLNVEDIRIRQQNANNTFQLEDFAGTGTLATSVEAYLVAQNPGNTADVRTGASVVQYTTMDQNNANTPAPFTPLLASGPGDGDSGALSQADAELLLGAAIQRWSDAGASAEQLAAMHGVSISVSDMIGLQVGASDGNQIRLDDDAAGHGWFVDATADDDSEFVFTGTGLSAAPGSGAERRIDALSVIVHELGHQIGLDDLYQAGSESNPMHGYIDPGERLLAAGAFTSDGTVFAADLAFAGGMLLPIQDNLAA